LTRLTVSARLRAGVAWLWQEWLKPLLVVAIVLGPLRSAVADWNDVPSGSMKPTILEGDRIFVNKLAYDLKVPFTSWRIAAWADPQRGDIVVFWSPYDGQRLVKRVVGVPGDRIEMSEQRLLVNGEAAAYAPLPEESIRRWDLGALSSRNLATERLGERSHPVMSAQPGAHGSSFGPITVPPGSYFLMGDHRDNSFDSRFWGFVERNRIVGRATAVVVSLDYDNRFRPRWHRFFSALP
jgi:signal peptidase I